MLQYSKYFYGVQLFYIGWISLFSVSVGSIVENDGFMLKSFIMELVFVLAESRNEVECGIRGFFSDLLS